MTYTPRPIDFTDHADRDEERITIDVDGDTYARLAAAADAAGESVDDVAERALIAGDVEFQRSTERGHADYEAGRFERLSHVDYCEDVAAIRAVLRDLLAAYPRLSSEFSTAEQQRAVRAARAALGGGE